MKQFFIYLILFISFFNVKAQGTWTNYTISNTSKTIPNPFVFDIAIDSKGIKWFATMEGLSRFDGQKYTTFTTKDGLLENDVRVVEVNKQTDEVWIGTASGVQVYNGLVWKNYTTKEGLVSNSIKTIAFDKTNKAWIGTFFGISIQNGTTWTNYNDKNGMPSSAVLSFAFDDKGNTWMGGSGAVGVMKFDGTKFTPYDKDIDGLSDNYGLTMCFDSQKRLWVGGLKGYSIFDGVKWASNTKYTSVYGIQQDSKGNIWMACEVSPYRRLVKFNGNAETVIDKINGANLPSWQSLMIEKDVLWLGSYTGAHSFNGQQWSSFSIEGGLVSNSINIIKPDVNDNMYIGTYEGLNKIINNQWQNTSASNLSIPYFDVSDILIDNASTWIAASYTIHVFEGAKYYTYSYPTDDLPFSSFNCLFKDSKGRKWIGSDYDAARFDGSKWTEFTQLSGKLIGEKVKTITEDLKGNLWFGTNKGISVFNGTSSTHYTKANTSGLNNDYITKIFVDNKGVIWIGSNGNVVKYDGATWTTYKEPGTYVGAINQDAKGNMWFGSSYFGGLTMFDGTKWTKFNTQPGPLSSSVKTIAFDKKGNVWVGTDKGISVYGAKVNVPTQESIITENIINVFPNPATDELNIESAIPLFETTFQLLDMNGKEYKVSLQDNKIDIKGLPRGIYFLNTKTPKGFMLNRFVKL